MSLVSSLCSSQPWSTHDLNTRTLMPRNNSARKTDLEKAVGEKIKADSCNACHIKDESKKMRNPYGKKLGAKLPKYDKAKWGWPMVDQSWPVRPNSLYGSCKVFCEALGRFYSDKFDISVLVIRLGAVLEPDAPYLRRHYCGWLGQQDYVSMVDKCLSAPMSIRYDIFDAISNNRYKWRSTNHASGRP